ncbi:hypothetical protein [Herbidospora daliensis]|uniref:hypothetical protein n=1 Tax=Herbidospora daliensis TaxID=295585 RepID=UPI0012FBC8B5|nr:hypothetical protein [Herbidospora daliensis]
MDDVDVQVAADDPVVEVLGLDNRGSRICQERLAHRVAGLSADEVADQHVLLSEAVEWAEEALREVADEVADHYVLLSLLHPPGTWAVWFRLCCARRGRDGGSVAVYGEAWPPLLRRCGG